MRRCLTGRNGFSGEQLMNEYHIKTHWQIYIIGSRGSGMFNHSDSLLTSSWHAHLQVRPSSAWPAGRRVVLLLPLVQVARACAVG
jgi:hypothetical protein